MKKSRFSEQQIAFVLRQAEIGTPGRGGLPKAGINEASLYSWQEVWRAVAVGDETRPDSMSAVPCSVPLAAPSAPPHSG
jgi:putative transposase